MTKPPKPFVLRFYFEPTPSMSDPEGADTFYHAIGVAVVAWGRLEGLFVSCLMTLTSLAKDTKVFQRPIPGQWEQRAELWKDAYESLPALRPQKTRAEDFVKELLIAVEDRNTTVHGMWQKFTTASPLTLELVAHKRVKGARDKTNIWRGDITLSGLHEISKTANRLNFELYELAQFISRHFGPAPSDAHRV